jgi:hypothetical protein
MALSFPASPSVGQTATVNGRQYVYVGNNVWELVASTAIVSSVAGRTGTITLTAADVSGVVSSVAGRTGTVTLTSADVSGVVPSTTTGITGATAITNIVSLTQSSYDALGSKSATTFYIVSG